ncbi:MAG: hypothetical protein A2046_16630 [Bacteroidetes bacterium GWA2_30_7]|nr:MAG: hypothetical protein A2046_16630 [Bacteroidetes bacterium GWA2_30_7]
MKTNSLKKSESNLTKFSTMNLIEMKNVKGGGGDDVIVVTTDTDDPAETNNRGSFAVSGKSNS